MTTQSQRQTALNAVLVEAVRDFLDTYPDTTPQTIANALDDARSDVAQMQGEMA